VELRSIETTLEASGAWLAGFEDYAGHGADGFFAPGRVITVGRAPARIDCMGGIADYSGSVVFEGTLSRAAVVGFQLREDRLVRVRSGLLERQGLPCEVDLSLDELRRHGKPVGYEEARKMLTSTAENVWAAYLIGGLFVLEKEGLCRIENGANMLLWSDVPVGVGVASSAAVEVAAMFAASGALNVPLDGLRLAEFAQVVENRVVGAPCGIMDQVTSALGQEGKLLALLCQPSEVLGHYDLPADVGVFGISSRVQHSVGGEAYTCARVSAFMGLKIILHALRQRGQAPREQDYYLCNISPEDYRRQFRELLPETITGSEFLRTYGPTTDAVTSVDPARTYSVRSATEHAIYENYRVCTFMECIERARAGDRTALIEAGGLMYASHCSYGWNCGLGCEETDVIVRLVMERGPERGLYGAKITGGGSGGTVAVLARKDAREQVCEVARDYQKRTGIEPDLFEGSSPGACAFGHRRYALS